MKWWIAYLVFSVIGIVAGFLLCLLIKKIVSIKDIGNGILLIFQGAVARVDRLLTGNDDNYSHVRFVNVLWGVGNFVIICITTFKKIEIPAPILTFMGLAMGLTNTQAFLNKRQEIQQVLGTITTTENPKGK